MQPECLQQYVLQTWRHSQLEQVQKILDVQQVNVALLLLERSTEGLQAFVLGEACEELASGWEMELGEPESLHPLLAPGVELIVVVGEYWGSLVVVVGDQPTKHPEQLASMDDQC